VLAVLKEYKALYATQHRMPNKLVLPEGLKLVPLYALAVMKVRRLHFHLQGKLHYAYSFTITIIVTHGRQIPWLRAHE
jgi:hypothetical protein